MAMTRSEMAALLERILKLFRELDDLEGEEVDEVDRPRPGPPASEREIDQLAKELGVDLPPSYRMFLSIHNGWRNWVGVQHLLSTKEQRSPDWKRKIDAWKRRMWGAGEGGGVQGIVAAAPEGAQTWVYIDASQMGKNGEMEVAYLDSIDELHRWKDFGAYLESIEGDQMKLVQVARRKRRK